MEIAIEAAQDKKATNVIVLDLAGVCSFTDRFLICTGGSARQTHAIADNVVEKLSETGLKPSHVEGRTKGDWILLDYVDFVVHVFTPDIREFYDLERLWRQGKRVAIPEPSARRG